MLCVTDDEVRRALVSHGDRVEVSKGSVLFEDGMTANGMYLVITGKIQTKLKNGDNNKMERIAESGSLLGVPATINGAAYSISATVKEDAELIHVSRPQLLELMRNDPAVALAIIDMLSREVREMRLEIKKYPRAKCK